MSVARVMIGMIAVSTMALSGCQTIRRITSTAQAGEPGPLSRLDGVAEAMRDTIAERLAHLEIERSTLLMTRRATSPEVTGLERRRLLLCRELTEVQRSISVEAFTTARVLRAVEGRLAGLAVDRALMLARSNAGSPEVRAIDQAMLELQRRRLQLREPRSAGELRACL